MLELDKVIIGADPEGFFSKDGVIVGSEKVIPKKGLFARYQTKPVVVRDGVQFELNPLAAWNISDLRTSIANGMTLLAKQLTELDNNVVVDWRGLVEVGESELASLSSDTRLLGCNPSLNIYEEWAITVDPLTYRKRSAGGHLHFGLNQLNAHKNFYTDRGGIVPYLDIFVGNTLVMLDRDPGAAERRENYGRAGEYREPEHGLEYRTPSNFWLRHVVLMDLVFGLAAIAFATVSSKWRSKVDIAGELTKVVDIEAIRTAINTNDANLARANWLRLRPFLQEYLPPTGFVMGPADFPRFETFIEGVNEKGLVSFFPTDPLVHWSTLQTQSFKQFLNTLY